MVPPPSPVLLLFALQREAAPLLPLARAEPRLMIGVTGVGRARAERALQNALRQCAPAFIITAGFAGALRPGLPVGTVLFDADFRFPLTSELQAAGAFPGRFHCANHMVITAREKAALHQETGADAVEMESGWLRPLCQQAGLPAATVRVISDTAAEDLPLDFNRLTDARQQLSPLKLAGAILKSPRVLPGLWRLQRQTAFASHALAQVLERSLRPWLATA